MSKNCGIPSPYPIIVAAPTAGHFFAGHVASLGSFTVWVVWGGFSFLELFRYRYLFISGICSIFVPMESKTFTAIVPVAQEFFNEFPFRVISAGTPPSWWGRLLIKWKLKSPEKLGYVCTEFPVVFNTDILKPGDRVCPAERPQSIFHLIIQTLPEKTKEGYEYGVRHIYRDFHAYYPSNVVREGARFVRVGYSGKNPILAQ